MNLYFQLKIQNEGVTVARPDNAYHREYQRTNVKQIKIAVNHEEFAAFEEYCIDFGETKAGLLKRLVNADAIKNGYQPIFDTIKSRSVNSQEKSTPTINK